MDVRGKHPLAASCTPFTGEQAHTQTGDRTSNLLVHGVTPNQLSNTIKGKNGKIFQRMGRYLPVSLKQKFVFKPAKQDIFQINPPPVHSDRNPGAAGLLGHLLHHRGTRAAVVYHRTLLSPASSNLGSESWDKHDWTCQGWRPEKK